MSSQILKLAHSAGADVLERGLSAARMRNVGQDQSHFAQSGPEPSLGKPFVAARRPRGRTRHLRGAQRMGPQRRVCERAAITIVGSCRFAFRGAGALFEPQGHFSKRLAKRPHEGTAFLFAAKQD